MSYPGREPDFICRQCQQSDGLYQDAHGVFCHHCGPSVPVDINRGGNLHRFATIDARKK